jgi:flagellar hook assembly protein FlgD
MFTATLPAAGAARVELFDVSGRRVQTLHSGPLPAGESVLAWDGRLAGGAAAPAGVYFAALTADAGRRVARVPVTR